MDRFGVTTLRETGSHRFTVRGVPYSAWSNGEYGCLRSEPFDATEGHAKWPSMVHLILSRLDAGPVYDRAAMAGAIGQLVGPGRDAVQLYPAESRVLNLDNAAHLWVFPNPACRFPLGCQVQPGGAWAEIACDGIRYQWSNGGRYVPDPAWPELTEILIRRPDQGPVESWPHLQTMKNAALGREHEAIERIDGSPGGASPVTLFAITDRRIRFPFGFKTRRTTAATPAERAAFMERHLRAMS